MAASIDPLDTTYAAGLCYRNGVHVLRLAWRADPHISFDESGVCWLDEYIEESRPHLGAQLLDEFVQFTGCFYGECLIAAFGGAWSNSDGQLAIFSDGLGYTFPFRAVERQLRSAQAGSIKTAYLGAITHVTKLSTARTHAA